MRKTGRGAWLIQRVAAGMEKEKHASGPKVNRKGRGARRRLAKAVSRSRRTLALMNEQLKWRDALGLQDEK